MGETEKAGGTAVAEQLTRLNIEQIEALIPHRYPFLLVDRVLEMEPPNRIRALKNVSANEPFFQGHFPGHKIMPGVLIIEALAQAAAIMSIATPQNRGGALVYLAGLEKTRFRRPVVPGDALILEVELLRMRGPYGIVAGRALVEGELAASAEIKFAFQGPPED
jgi:3-hydroxyacyl-[acyl-carrier-protein] dehydratase